MANTGGGASDISAGPAPATAAAPIGNSGSVGTTSGSENSNGSSAADFGITLLMLGEETGKIIITGTESIPIVIGGAVGVGMMGLQEWARPKNYHPPTNVPTGDISIGLPKPYIPPSLLSSYPRGESVYPFPGWDPTKAPSGFEWKGRDGSVPGDKKGSYQNPGTKEVLSPNLDHAQPYGPHWDYKDKEGDWHRVYPDGTSQQKKDR